jgi:HAD superfamily hydrolase (TIGR01509 family)
MKWNRTAPLPPIRGVLLDMDGLLIDSEHIAQQCCIQAGYDLGYPIDQTLARRFLGVTHDGCVQILQDAFPGIDAESLFRHSRELLKAQFEKSLTAKPGALALLIYLKDAHVPFALASSSSRERTENCLRLTGLLNFFPESIRITGEKAIHSKPAPDLFLQAAACLNVPSANCLVLEDSVNGITAGRAAGCVVCMVPDLIPYTESLRSQCDLVAQDLADVLACLKQMIQPIRLA